MEFLKELFGDGTLTFDQLVEKAKEKKINAVDLSAGGYVAKEKYDSKVGELNGVISDLKGQIKTRDDDIASVKANLEKAQADAGKLASVNTELATLQEKYKTDMANFEKRLADNRYEFQIREKAGELKFSSKAAKASFIAEAIKKQFKQDGETLLGYEDFVKNYKADDPGAFVTEQPKEPEPNNPQPRIVGGTNPAGGKGGPKYTLSQMMAMKNENPNLQF